VPAVVESTSRVSAAETVIEETCAASSRTTVRLTGTLVEVDAADVRGESWDFDAE
jgi:hypothetical protein